MPLPSVLFICTANLNRSPIAEHLFRGRLKDRREDWSNWRIESAGTWAKPGLPPTREAQKVMSRYGIDISAHRSRAVTQELLDGFRLILTMEQGHKEGLQVEFCSVANRIHMLSEMVDLQVPILDPMGGVPDLYDAAVEQISRWLERGFERIVWYAEAGNVNITL